jgi:hypothetical protein
MGLERIVSLPRRVLLASAETIASRLAGVTRSRLFLDPAQWVREVLNAHRALGCRTVLLGSAACIAAEAFGSTVDWEQERIVSPPPPGLIRVHESGRWNSYLESLKRLLSDPRRDGVVALLPEPRRLASRLGIPFEEDFVERGKTALVTLVEDICRCRPDLLLLEGESAFGGTAPSGSYRRLFGTLRNLGRHFDVPVGIAAAGGHVHDLPALVQLRPDALLLGVDAEGGLPSLDAARQSFASVELIGIGVDLLDSKSAHERARAARELPAEVPWCLYQARELPANVDLAQIRGLVTELQAA